MLLKSHQAAGQEQSTARIFAHYSLYKMNKSAQHEMHRLCVVWTQAVTQTIIFFAALPFFSESL